MTLLAGGRPADPDDPSADAAYARALARGEPQAARCFMARNLPTVLGIARRLLRDEAEAEDAAQDVFVKVWKNAHRWEPGRAKFDTWVGRIAINTCYDRLRRRREASGEDLPERADGAAGADDLLGAEAGARRVRGALASLPERQRLALELCHFQEHTNIEAAEMMEISIEAVESLLARGRRALRAALAGEADELIADLAASRGEEA
ncbi:RNA polymerase sigma factor [Marinicauda algicola]|uniref:RNA polymerase sigma factor n=1 Tax=Marinicauda algicola TaxID=2029849 RepID=A0A4S2H336_9PROT|nr:RNA polymerase sigma factor [Marinicauda algicola]TGY89964.1 RNA polymerase sigma factor [Marinicauda algicola]